MGVGEKEEECGEGDIYVCGARCLDHVRETLGPVQYSEYPRLGTG